MLLWLRNYRLLNQNSYNIICIGTEKEKQVQL